VYDTHCHLDDPRYDEDRDEVVARARANGLSGLLVPGVSPERASAVRAVAARYGFAFAVGLHPHALPRSRRVPDDPTGAAAIGECGLDAAVAVPMDEQVEVLHAHLVLARDAGLPVILHCQGAHDRMLEVLRPWAPLRGVMHSYSGGAGRVDAFVRMGLHLSYGGAITWERARRPVEALRHTPLDRLLAETDGPDQCPRPERGRNEPAWLLHIVARMEELRGAPVGEALRSNAAALGWT